MKQFPAERRYHESAGDPQHRQRDAEELQSIGAKEQRAGEQDEAVYCHLAGKRVTLTHAATLGFEHPTSKAAMRFHSPLPADMAALLEALHDSPPAT